MKFHPNYALPCAMAAGLLLAGCVKYDHNATAMALGSAPPKATEIRQAQTRTFNASETQVLMEATQTLQDLGYTLTETSSPLGVLVGTKTRDATETGEVAGQVALTVLSALLGGGHSPSWDTEQEIRATIVTTPVGQPAASRQTMLRVSFQRIVRRTDGNARVELLTENQIYQEFFNKFHQTMTVAQGN